MVLSKTLQKYLDVPALFNGIRHILCMDQKKYVKRILKPCHFKKILDVGSGTGDFANAIDAQYVGIDSTPSFVEYSNEKYESKNKKFYLMDATKLNFKNNEFDAAMLISFIHHLPDKLVIDILRSVKRVVKKKIIIIDLIPPKTSLISKFFYALDRGGYIRSLDKQIELVKKAGVLTIEKVSDFKTTPGIYRHSVIICKPKR